MTPRIRALSAYLAVAAVLAVVVVRHQPATAELADTPNGVGDANPTTVAVAAPTTTVATAPAAVPATTTEEARPAPAAPVVSGDVNAAAATAVGFLRGWTLRGSWDDRRAALMATPAHPAYATAEYVAAVAYTDPDLANLPPGTVVTVDTAHVAVSPHGSAVVPASVDGFAVVVHEVRVATGWLVDSHRPV